MRRMALLIVLFPALLFAGHPKPCVTADEASRMTNKDLCVDAHVCDVVQLPDGTRFLDVCSPDTPDELCRFTIVSLRADREDVGDLRNYRDSNVHIRGIVQPMHGRAGILLSHSRQFTGGPPKFKPNPRLIRGFSGDQQRPPISDPNLRSHGGHRAFMNTRDQIPLDKSTSSPK
jgi:hypothetical protein